MQEGLIKGTFPFAYQYYGEIFKHFLWNYWSVFIEILCQWSLGSATSALCFIVLHALGAWLGDKPFYMQMQQNFLQRFSLKLLFLLKYGVNGLKCCCFGIMFFIGLFALGFWWRGQPLLHTNTVGLFQRSFLKILVCFHWNIVALVLGQGNFRGATSGPLEPLVSHSVPA